MKDKTWLLISNMEEAKYIFLTNFLENITRYEKLNIDQLDYR